MKSEVCFTASDVGVDLPPIVGGGIKGPCDQMLVAAAIQVCVSLETNRSRCILTRNQSIENRIESIAASYITNALVQVLPVSWLHIAHVVVVQV